MLPVSLYIHFPWCVKKCPYCDFNSHENKGFDEANYISQLLKDFRAAKHHLQGRPLHSIFMGGGTPSLFSPKSIETLLKGLRAEIDFKANIEISLEANPGTNEHGLFKGYADAGINRLSIGIQSFNAAQLKKLGRIHNGEEALTAAKAAQDAGFLSFNLDLMHGLPDQTEKGAENDLAAAIAQSPQHISWYQLTIEPNTLFFKQPPKLPADPALEEIFLAGIEQLQAAGYQQYEISAFAKPNFECQHNLNYWRFGDYLGIGAGAHSKITDYTTEKIKRLVCHKTPARYLGQIGTQTNPFHSQEQWVSEADLPLEYFMNRLRLSEGFTASDFEAATFLPFNSVEQPLLQAQSQGLLAENQGVFKKTPKGNLFLNDFLLQFLP